MSNFKIYELCSKDKERLISTIKSELFKYEEIVFAYIYGSFVDPHTPFFRDIDVGIYLDENLVSYKDFLDYCINLSLQLESIIKTYPVDVVILNDAPLSLAYRITQGELLFMRDEDLWIEFVTKTCSLYHDHAITSRNLLEDIIKA